MPPSPRSDRARDRRASVACHQPSCTLMPKLLVISPNAHRAGLDVGFELLCCGLAESRADLTTEVDAREVMKRSAYGDAFATPIHCLSESPRSCGLLTTMRRTFRSSSALTTLASASGDVSCGGWPWKSIDRELGPRHRMLRDDERRLGLVLADVRNRELWLTARTRAGARSALPRCPCGPCAMATAAAAMRMNTATGALRVMRSILLGQSKVSQSAGKPNSVPFARRLTRLAQA